MESPPRTTPPSSLPALASDLLSDALDHPCRTTSRCRSRSRFPRRRSAAPNGRPKRSAAPNGRLIGAVVAGHAVDQLADDVDVAGVAGGLLDHVDQDPAQGDRVAQPGGARRFPFHPAVALVGGGGGPG